MPVPQNAKTIYGFLTAHGFTPNAAAGVLGNIEQESGGDPRAGSNPPGSGLIQQLGFPPSDLATAMQGILTYISGPGGGSVQDINAHSPDPASAALYFSNRYERPNAALANNANRMQSARDVAAAAKSGNWPANAQLTSANAPAGTGGLPNPFNVFGDIGGIAGALGSIASFFTTITKDFQAVLHGIQWLLNPTHWIRIISFGIGMILLLLGVNNLRRAGRGDMSLAMGILEVTAAGVFLFIAFHNLPDDIRDLRGLLIWIAGKIGSGARSSPASPAPAPAPASPPALAPGLPGQGSPGVRIV